MRSFMKVFKYYALVPFIASLPGFALCLFGFTFMELNLLVVPALTAAYYFFRRRKEDMAFAARVNGIILLVLLICFTIMMAIGSGNVDGVVVSNFSWFILPFLPIEFIMLLMGQHVILYGCAWLSYLAAFAVTAYYSKYRIKKLILPAVGTAVCLVVCTVFYMNQPALKYGGHGFAYMHGYSSTDFTDYMVYAKNSKLAKLDHDPEWIIDQEEEMPVLDGAEACYPLYAALAKTLYKEIDQIELEALKDDSQYDNGKIVTFTNTISGFQRLVFGGSLDRNEGSIDLFFGARPSADQLGLARSIDVEIEVTPIGKEAFVFFVEEDNPIENLTSEQIRAIYHGDITNWSELGGKDQEIIPFQRPRNSGSQTMMEYFMGDITLKEPKTYEKVDAMAGVIKQVAQYANEKGAMGYSFRYFLEELNQEKGVKMLQIDGVSPTMENIENGSYPLVTSLCVVSRKNDPNPNVQRMIDFILSEDGQELVRQSGYAGMAQE